jgi:hypothetical protein
MDLAIKMKLRKVRKINSKETKGKNEIIRKDVS